MKQVLFKPTGPQMAVLAVIAAASIAYAALLRFTAIEVSAVALACDAGRADWLCQSRKVALAFSQPSAFGAIAFGAALLNLLRPSVVLCAVALATACFGLVLYNTAASAVAVALLAFSLARPAPEAE